MKSFKKVLITGGTGFIGRNTLEKLIENDVECWVITRQNLKDTDKVKYLNLDLSEFDTATVNNVTSKIGEFDAIIYMAASIPVIGAKKETFYEAKVNTLDPLVKFCELFIPLTKKFIYISSIDVVGINTDYEYNEECNVNPVTPYAIAKYCGEIYANSICNSYKIPCTILRFSQVYGPNEPLVRVIPILRKAIKENDVFNKFTTGEEKRRFLYVEDAANSILLALKSNASGIFNIAGKDISSINDLINICEEVYNKKINLSIKGDTIASDNMPSISKAEKVLKYIPKYNLKEGISRIYDEENHEKY